MKNVLFITVLCGISAFASAQFQYFSRMNTQGNVSGHDVNMYYAAPLSNDTSKLISKFKFTSFALIEQGWAEGLAGIAYSPTSWLEVGLSIGLEQNPALLRGCGTVYLGKGNYSFFTAFEKGDGPDNWWYKSIAKYQKGKFAYGILSWRYQVTGPVIEYSPTKQFKLWVNPGRNLESGVNAVVMGFDINL